MAAWFDTLICTYLLKLVPGFGLAALLLICLPKRWPIPRIFVHIACFILARDAMTNAGFWQVSSGAIRLTAAEPILWTLSLISISLAYAIYRLESSAAFKVHWIQPTSHIKHSLLIAAIATLAVLALVLVAKQSFALNALVAPSLTKIWPIFAFALLGNAYEELLFRGLLQQKITEYTNSLHAAWLSALAFSFCHIFLAFNLTQVGTPLLVFTLIEGYAAALAYRQSGLLAAALTHGLIIFVLAMGFI